MNATNALIQVKALTKKFGDFVAVNALTFDVPSGEIFGMVGPNGAGKSTLIRMLTTLVLPTSGTAVIAGSDILEDPDGVRRAIGVIPQAMTSDIELSARENLIIFAKLYDVPRERREQLIPELLEAVGLTAWADNPLRQLSGGMRRRVEIARGLVHEPHILFLDEPTTGLDPVSRAGVWEMLERIKQERDLTVVLTTHYMDEADKLCERLAIVDHGTLLALDSPLALKAAVPSRNTIDVSFADAPPDWEDRLKTIPEVDGVSRDGQVFRVTTNDGPAVTMAILDSASQAHVTVRSLAVESTTLDDVFVHYTGRELRDTLQAPSVAENPLVLPQR